MVDIVNSNLYSVVSGESFSFHRLCNGFTSHDSLITSHCLSVPADRRLIQIDMNLLGLEILLDAPRAQFTSETGLLESAPGRFHVCWLHMIDPDDTGAQRLHRPHRLKDVTCPDGSRQAIRRIVRYLHRVFFVFEWNH